MSQAVALAQLHRLNQAAARAGLTLRVCGAGGYLLAGSGWQAHSDDPGELLDALDKFLRPKKTDYRPTTDRTDRPSSTFFLKAHHHGTDRI